MPITGVLPVSLNDPPYFKNLKDLDDWIETRQSTRGAYDGVQKYVPRSKSDAVQSAGKGKLLVCHDYKGGYTESPFDLCYTFNFWSSCDVFIYFSHHLVTIPPPGWITAAHRQGVKMLGTLIFEGGSESDCLRLLVGKMPNSKTGPAGPQGQPISLPLSPYYARLLAELAHERGFDGYLLNFECPLTGRFEQTRALAGWITLLQSEILARVGPHGETVWYDSVVITGQLAWQDRLNSFNLPFFLSSTSFFSNYTWRPEYPNATAQYFLSLDPALTGNNDSNHPHTSRKTLQDIYMGVDVWGRGSYGGGGFGAYKAITLIAPESLGLSVALFGPAWTWESEQDKPGWDWDKWWAYESKLWVGPIDGEANVPGDSPPVPIVSFFRRHSPPDPLDLPFNTTFCPGVGRAWYVNGVKVFQGKIGWTDIDKQSSVGDMVWPRPHLQWEDECPDELPGALSAICMDDAWNGGSSLRLSLSESEEGAEYQCIWLPIQTINITSQETYVTDVIFKVEYLTKGVELDLALAVKVISDTPGPVQSQPLPTTEFARGWTKLSSQFTETEKSTTSLTVTIGFIVTLINEDCVYPLELSLLVGQLSIYPLLPANILSKHDTQLIWADFQRTSDPSQTFKGQLTWEATVSLPVIRAVTIVTADDPVSAWPLQPSDKWFPEFLYFNIYAQPYQDNWSIGGSEDAIWIGTSGSDGKKNAFLVTQNNLPFPIQNINKVRFYVQGVTDRGEVMKWNKSTFVDVSI